MLCAMERILQSSSVETVTFLFFRIFTDSWHPCQKIEQLPRNELLTLLDVKVIRWWRPGCLHVHMSSSEVLMIWSSQSALICTKLLCCMYTTVTLTLTFLTGDLSYSWLDDILHTKALYEYEKQDRVGLVQSSFRTVFTFVAWCFQSSYLFYVLTKSFKSLVRQSISCSRIILLSIKFWQNFAYETS